MLWCKLSWLASVEYYKAIIIFSRLSQDSQRPQMVTKQRSLVEAECCCCPLFLLLPHYLLLSKVLFDHLWSTVSSTAVLHSHSAAGHVISSFWREKWIAVADFSAGAAVFCCNATVLQHSHENLQPGGGEWLCQKTSTQLTHDLNTFRCPFLTGDGLKPFSMGLSATARRGELLSYHKEALDLRHFLL